MKITNWRKKLSATLVAGGLFIPSTVDAAGLGVNLVANPGFELVGAGGINGTSQVLNWGDGPSPGFAYQYSQNYDFGGPLAGGGAYYFTSNNGDGTGTDVTAPATVLQIIDVSSGPSAVAIGNGSATFNLSAFFTSYANAGAPGGTDADIGNIELRFVDAANAGLSAVILSDPSSTSGWKQGAATGPVPAGTAKLFVSLYGTPTRFGPDGYIDNVDLRLSGVPEASSGVLAAIGGTALGMFRWMRRRKD